MHVPHSHWGGGGRGRRKGAAQGISGFKSLYVLSSKQDEDVNIYWMSHTLAWCSHPTHPRYPFHMKAHALRHASQRGGPSGSRGSGPPGRAGRAPCGPRQSRSARGANNRFHYMSFVWLFAFSWSCAPPHFWARLGTSASARERLGALGSVWGRVGARGGPWEERAASFRGAWGRLGARGGPCGTRAALERAPRGRHAPRTTCFVDDRGGRRTAARMGCAPRHISN